MPIKRPPIQDLSVFILQTHQVEKLKVSIEKLTIDNESESTILETKKSELAVLETELNDVR